MTPEFLTELVYEIPQYSVPFSASQQKYARLSRRYIKDSTQTDHAPLIILGGQITNRKGRGSQTSSSNFISIHRSPPPPPTENINIPEVDSQYVEDSSATTYLFFPFGTIKCLQVLQLVSLTHTPPHPPSLAVSVVYSPFAEIPGPNARGSPRLSVGIVTVRVGSGWFVTHAPSFPIPQSSLGVSFWTAL